MSEQMESRLELTSFEPMKVARVALAVAWPTPGSGSGLWWYRGNFWEYRAGRWVRRTEDEMEGALYRVLENAGRRTEDGFKRYAPNGGKIADVIGALKGLCASRWSTLPQWTRSVEGDPDPENCIGFLNGVVSVEGGKVRLVEDAGERWLDTSVCRVAYEEGAGCPRWLEALEQWSQGSLEWKTLLQRWFGYCLMGTRRYEKWLLMQAPVRAGKGTIVTILEAIMGEGAVLAKDFKTLKGEYGLAGLEVARVLVINEVKQSESWEGEEVVRVAKSLVGQDPLTVNAGKWKPVLENVRCKAAVMMSSNEIPNLPNRAGGLSSKMLVLPFAVSFKGREDTGLKEQLLREELPGIAAWCVEGARQVVEVERDERWPLTDVAREKIRVYEMLANVYQEFMEECFIPDPEGFVSDEVVVATWKAWLARNQLKRVSTPPKHLLARIEAETSWGVQKVRSKRVETRDQVGLTGCALKKNPTQG